MSPRCAISPASLEGTLQKLIHFPLLFLFLFFIFIFFMSPHCHSHLPAHSHLAGIGLALACAVRGYRCIIVLPEKMSAEKVRPRFSTKLSFRTFEAQR